MKSELSYEKLRGGYYTPQQITDYIVKWAVRTSNSKVLEPSCGDGHFICSIVERMKELGGDENTLSKNILGIELDPTESQKASVYGADIINGDFFTFYKNSINKKIKFDAIVGNPPFIRYQNFDENFRMIAFDLMKEYGFHPTRLTNIWLPFLILSCFALSDNGRIGMVIPAELFQVDYAAEARCFLSSYFDNLILITFKKLLFEDIQQEVVLLLGEKRSKEKGIKVIELEDILSVSDDLKNLVDYSEIKDLDHSTDKWIKYYLSNNELEFLSKLNHDDRISDAKSLYEVNVGLVSGENAFFVMSNSTATKHNLHNYVYPIISRSEQVKGISLSNSDFQELIDSNKRIFLFNPEDVDLELLSPEERNYILYGEDKKYNKNYKCRIRKHWYHVPESWIADAFLIRQANHCPRMILNNKKAYVTDTLHKVRFNKDINPECVVSAFLNSYTLALSETLGRSYGGGVLTFEPGEMRKMRIPMLCSDRLSMQKIDDLYRQGKLEEVLDYTDKILLVDGLNLTWEEVLLLRGIWDKLKNRRLMRRSL